MFTFKTQSPAQTETIARDIAGLLPPRSVVLLAGELGMGKTVFARALIRALVGQDTLPVPSPTFTLTQIYPTPTGDIWHFDLYRLKSPVELDELGWDAARGARLVLIEWPEKLGNRLKDLKNPVAITLTSGQNQADQRTITLDLKGMKTPETAFVYAAGLGNRMRPLTDVTPKPLIPVNGRPILSYTFDMMAHAGIRNVVLNTHSHADQIESFLDPYRGRFNIQTSYEETPLETGGGLKKALPLIQEETFFTINGDMLAFDGGGVPALHRLAQFFDPSKMDMALMMVPYERDSLAHGTGDYDRDDQGRLTRSAAKTGAYTYGGIRLQTRALMDQVPEEKVSILQAMDAAQATGRLYGLVHTGDWYHLSTPSDVDDISAHLAALSRRAMGGAGG